MIKLRVTEIGGVICGLTCFFLIVILLLSWSIAMGNFGEKDNNLNNEESQKYFFEVKLPAPRGGEFHFIHASPFCSCYN